MTIGLGPITETEGIFDGEIVSGDWFKNRSPQRICRRSLRSRSISNQASLAKEKSIKEANWHRDPRSK